MNIGGMQKCSLIDYPGKLCAVIFTQGCNFRCPYCHNPSLVINEKFADPLLWDDIYDFLQHRQGKLDAVTISGGEPTLHQDLFDYIRIIKKNGFLVKLDTNGTNPDMLQSLIDEQLVDYVAMDLKTSLPHYNQVTKISIDPQKIQKSIKILEQSSISYEFRTTLVHGLLATDDIKSITRSLSATSPYYLQKFVSHETLDPTFSTSCSFTDDEIAVLKTEFLSQKRPFNIR